MDWSDTMALPDDFGRGTSRSVALVGTFPPTACGLATFTSNLQRAMAAPPSGWEVRVVRVLDRWEPPPSDVVIEQWVAGDPGSLRRSLAALNSFEAVLLQHEYWLFGGNDGEDVLGLVGGLDVPLVAVLHTAWLEPSPHQREILERIVEAAAMVVVQSEVARQRILAVHDADPKAVVVIPHGAAPNFAGPVMAPMPRPVVLTWGLLSPGKGIEHGIAAVAKLQSPAPAVSYVIAGQTHPKERASNGERYRESLQEQARSLGVDGRVRFIDAYLDRDSLHALVRSIDVLLLPYDSRDQTSSGVLVEGVASGKPVVATCFPHAEELLAGGVGIVVDHGDIGTMADALHRVLHEPGLADRMAGAARLAAAPLLWPVVGASYRTLVDHVVKDRAGTERAFGNKIP